MTRPTVLLVEDDAASQYIFGTILTHHGYEVLYARTGGQALKMLRGDLPDAVVLDIGLPEIDGFELLGHVRADPRTADLPVLVATVHVFENDQARAVEAGCDVFLKKPLEPTLLIAEIDRLLGRDGAPAPGPG